MLKLKEVLASLGKPQTDLARAVDLSPAAIAQLINHSQWPKSLDQQQLAWRITEYLMAQGAQFDTVRQAFDEVGPRRSNVGAPATPEDAQENEECEPMLMRKQVLLPATKKAFDIRRDPFDELHSADDIFINTDIRYVREAMHQVAMHDGFLAVIGESGAGKSTLRRDLEHRLEGSPVTVIQPYVLGMEDNDTKGKPLKSEHIAEAILAEIAPDQTPRNSSQARWAQLHKALKASHTAGSRHLLIIEEAHSLSTPTIKHLKRYRELELGYTKLVSIILIGQPELLIKLSPRNGEVREVAQRIEIVELPPLTVGGLEQHLAFRFERVGKALSDVIDASGLQAVIERLGGVKENKPSLLYPLAIGNLVKAAMNYAALVGEPRVTADVVREA
ncbi:AAA family ATPase [Pseudomonas aeruginosa]|uniref:ExeA family protein n=1 Tax=Pseudomonas aeruginosa TaxID=287 RepID=UPI00345B36CA